MLTLWRDRGDGTRVRVRVTERLDGDASDPSTLSAERARWTLPRQVHGNEVVSVSAPGEGAGREADALMTDVEDAVLAIRTADCVPIALYSSHGVAAVHAGWRGLEEGVIQRAHEVLAAAGGGPQWAIVGPHIRPAAYEFGDADLARLVDRFGPRVRSRTSEGAPALDLTAAVRTVFGECGIDLDHDVGACTSGDRWFSHRTRGDTGRLAMLVDMPASHGREATSRGATGSTT